MLVGILQIATWLSRAKRVSFISEDNHQTVDHLPEKIACVASVSNRVIARKLERDATNSRGNACYASLRTADAFSVVPFFSEGEKRRPEMRLLFAGYCYTDYGKKKITAINST